MPQACCDPKPGGESEENMSAKNYPLCLAVAVLLAVGGRALARHVTHPVTPENLDKQPFAFAVQVKDAGEMKEVEITVRQRPGKRAPAVSAWGIATLAPRGEKQAASPAITRILANGVQTYTFRIAPSDVERATFTFSETPQDVRTPFPFPGDYWVFDLKRFVRSPKQ
jgi:hypothetical protein